MSDLRKIIAIARKKRETEIPADLSLRDKTILLAYRQLVPLPEIADYYGLSRERVRQIIEKYKI